VFDEMFEWIFHWLFNFIWCGYETMAPHLFKAQIRFNGGTHHSFKVRVNITLKDQLNEINQELNPEDTRRVEALQYARHGYLQGQKIILTDDECGRTMLSRHYRKHMFSVIELEATLLRSPEDIHKSLIMPENYV